jgi:hypothetical protein
MFFGCKLYLIINDKEAIIALEMTRGNVDNRSALRDLTED